MASLDDPRKLVVRGAQRQAAMQELLRRTDFLQIRTEMAKNFVPTLYEHEEEKLYYLVRSAALYEKNSDSFENLRFSAVYFSEVKTLNVYFFGLAARAVPKNVVLLIAVKLDISKAPQIGGEASIVIVKKNGKIVSVTHSR